MKAGKNNHHGSREWLLERISALISIPLLVWLVINLIPFNNAIEDITAFLSVQLNVVLLVVFIGNFLFYSTLAMKVVFEDYIHNIGVRNCLIKLMYVVAVAGFIIALAAILKIHG